MVGIVSYGAYIPKWRMSRSLLRAGLKGEKAVAAADEDSVTMAVAAGMDCVKGVDRNSIDGLFFASTNATYKEKQIATIVAAALDLRRDILTADFANSLRAGTAAIKAAVDAVKAGSARSIMVIASDMRLGAPESEAEIDFGDGAGAVLIGKDNVIVDLESSYSVSDEIFDVWRAEEDKFVRIWEDRFTQGEGYLKVTAEAIQGLFQKTNKKGKDFNKAILYAPNPRRGGELCKKLGFEPTAYADPIYDVVGNTGCAYPLMLLVSALEAAKAGDRLLLASYGNGSDAFSWQATEALEKNKVNHRGIAGYVGSKRAVPDYTTYLKWRKLLPKGMTIDKLYFWTYPSAPPIHRERTQIYPLHGSKCKTCGQIQFPRQRICAKCHAKDNNEEIRLSDKKATLHSFSKELATQQLIGLIDFEGGGRIWCNITDCNYEELKIDSPMEMSFREGVYDLGMHDYFWKGTAVR
jgi:hydroxymethylglutaryl-CoA synthase